MSFNRALSGNTSSHLIPLPAGGYWMQIGDVTMQIGCPPETIKDSMRMGLDVPRYFVVYGDLFERTQGINIAELEFPAYFNFFIRKQKTVVITTAEIEARLRRVFQETLLGPRPEDFDIVDDFAPHMKPDCFPDFTGEGMFLDPGRSEYGVDSLLEFRRFVHNADDGGSGVHSEDALTCVLNDEITVAHVRSGNMFEVYAPKYFELPLTVPHEVIRVDPNQVESLSMFRKEITDQDTAMELPLFGITMLGTSHGFDKNGTTTGFVVWANRRGTMVDPPPNAVQRLAAMDISPRVIDSIVLTHCHSDHDAGTFRKLLFDQNVTVITTKTIMNSFLRKYSAITNFEREFLHGLFSFKEVKIGEPAFLHGAKWEFFYSLHTIPCIGFKVSLNGKSLVYSADTHTDPDLAMRMYNEGVIGAGRRDSLMNFPWECDLILHEAGVPPIHTPMQILQNLSDDIKSRMFVVHVARKDVPAGSGLRMLHRGETVMLDVVPSPTQRAIEILDLFSTIDIFKEAMVTFQNALDVMFMVRYVSFESGELIVREGDPGDKCFIIMKGRAKVTWMVNGQHFQKSYNVGDYFGETSLVTGAPRNANVTAEGPVEAVAITRDTFLTLIQGTNIRENLVALAETRNKHSWQIMQQNSVISLFTSSCKTALETHMQEQTFKAGEVVWKVGDRPTEVILVKDGTFTLQHYESVSSNRTRDVHLRLSKQRKLQISSRAVSRSVPFERESDDLTTEGKTDDETDDNGNKTSDEEKTGSIRTGSSSIASCGPVYECTEGTFGSGTIIGDFDAMLSDDVVATTLTAVSDGSAMVVPRDRWIQFCSNYPGVLLFFLEKQVLS